MTISIPITSKCKLIFLRIMGLSARFGKNTGSYPVKSIFLSLFIFYTSVFYADAQSRLKTDSVVLSLGDAEKLFLERNFELLAAKYQINEADAAIIQAKLWDNPNLSIEQDVYDPVSKKWFDVTATGETAVNIQQLIYLAGKRNKRISIGKVNSEIARYQFYDLQRTLRYELRTSFFELYFLEQSISVYDRELTAAKKLVDAYNIEYQKGNVSFNEFARLQALQFGLENEKIELLKNINEKQSNLVLLTGDTLSRPIKPVVDISSYDRINPDSLSIEKLIETGLENRYDLKITSAQVKYEKANLALEKAMRTPDLTLGGGWDRQGSYVDNYNFLSVGIDLPLWNHNQGNIKIAENKIEESKVLKNENELEVKNDIRKAFEQLIETDHLFKASLPKFDNKYYDLLDGIILAYQNHTISLLEFIDYIETYKNSKTGFYQLQNNRIDAVEDLNMATGIDLMKNK
jgi:cobalt-zinc-cadmium efflux system outer membrane protein